MQERKTAARTWTRQQARLGRRTALPVIGYSLVATLIAAAQAACVALALGGIASTRPAACALFAVLLAARLLVQYLAETASFQAGAAGRARLRADTLHRMLEAGPALLRSSHSADLAATLVDRIEALDGLFARWIPAATLAIAAPLVILAIALAVDPFAAAVLFLAGLLVPLGQAVAGIGAAAASRNQFIAMARLQARFLDRVRGIATIVLSGRSEDEAAALGQAAGDLRARTMRVLRVAFLSSAALDCAMAAAIIIIALHHRAALAAAVGPSTRALFSLLLVPEFFAPFRAFAAAYQDRTHATAAAETLAELPASPAPLPQAAIRTIEARGLALSFENVRLTWDPARPPALNELNFFVAPGEMLVLTGPSGAGKSSVIELLLGFVRPDEGRILINGHDIADIVPQALSRLTAWIGQKPTLFAGTIADNIAFARADASQAEIEDAARAAQIDSFASALPLGLQTRIGEGGYGLSGGQAQRVAIARAFLKNAPLLLLDEPTAHLDPATEADVLASLKRLAIGRTVVMASHAAAAQSFGGRRLELRSGRETAARGAA